MNLKTYRAADDSSLRHPKIYVKIVVKKIVFVSAFSVCICSALVFPVDYEYPT
jgi:hypothetical protein